MEKHIKVTISLGIFLLAAAPALHAVLEDETSSYEKAMTRRQQVEIMGFFLRDPKDAKMPSTPIAVQLYNEAVMHYQNHEYDLARQSLQQAMQYDGLNGIGYELLGDLDYRQQLLNSAQSNYEIAYNLKPSARVKEKIEKLKRESIVEDKLSTYKEKHFLIKFHDEEVPFEGYELRELLRETYRAISRDFAFYFNHKIVVLLYDEKDFRTVTRNHRAAGLFDGKVRMPVSRRGFDDLELRAVIRHEITHAFVAAIGGLQVPAWINEGLSEYQENKVRPVDMLVFDSALATDTLFPLDQLMQQASVASLSDPIRLGLFYQQSFHLVSYMVDRFGMFRVKKILEEYKKGKDSDEAIRKVLKMSILRLEQRWKSSF